MHSAWATHVISLRTAQSVNIVVGVYVLQIVLLEHCVSQTQTEALENVYCCGSLADRSSTLIQPWDVFNQPRQLAKLAPFYV